LSKGKKTGGRRPGTPNKRSLVRREALTAAAVDLRAKLDAEASAPALDLPATQSPMSTEWFKGDAHELLRRIYSDPIWPMEMRIDAAKSAIRFERPALVASHVQHSNAPARAVLAQMSTVQLKALLLEMDADVIEGQAVESDPLPPPGQG
jgi:hypothetical protein